MNDAEQHLDGQTSASQAEYSVSVGERIARLEARIEDDDRSLRKRANKWMSLVALIISVFAGAYGLLDILYFQGQRERAAAADELRQITARLTELNWQLTELYAKNDLASVTLLSRLANGEKIPMLARADQIIDQYEHAPDVIHIVEYMLFSAEHLNFADNERAIGYARKAATAAEGSPAMQAEALRYLGRALFAQGTEPSLAEGREVLDRATATAQRITSYVGSSILMNIVNDQIVAEANFGDCGRAQAMLANLERDLGGIKMPKATMIELVRQLRAAPIFNPTCVL